MSQPQPQPRPDPQPCPGPRRPEVVAIFLGGVFALAGAAIVLSDRITTRADYDQKLYHLRAIRQFAAQWPDFDFWHYLSATTPGYHLLMAAVSKLVSPSPACMQVLAVAITCGLLALLGGAVGRATTPGRAVAFTLPLLCSMYVVDSGAFLLPDNLGWLLVLAILLVSLRERLTAAWLIAGGLILLALVFVRQIHIWSAALLWTGAYLCPASDGPAPGARELLFSNLPARLRSAALGVLVTLPAFGLLALFYRFWGGPVPPVFQGWYKGLNTSAAAFILATFGAYGIFFAPVWLPPLARLWRESRAWVLGPAALVLAYCLAVPTNGDRFTGRRSGLWDIAAAVGERVPLCAGRSSPFMIALALLGVLTLTALLGAVPARRRLIFLAALAGYTAASFANTDLFQRYVDPFVLMLLALLAAWAPEAPAPRRVLGELGPGILALVLAAMTVKGIVTTDRRVSGPDPPSRTPSQYDLFPPPCDVPPPPRPPGKHFWPWA